MATRHRRKQRNYKQVISATKDVGSAGGQVLIGSLSPLTARNQLGRAYCKNIVMTYILQGDAAADPDQGGVVFYISSNNTWADSDVITARARSFGGGTVNLPVHSWVSGEVTDDAPGGKLYVYAEATDVTGITDVDIRYTAEVWGSALLQYLAA